MTDVVPNNACPGFPATDIEEVECDQYYGRRLTGNEIGGPCGMEGKQAPEILVPTAEAYKKHKFPLTERYCNDCSRYVTVEDILERNPRLQRVIELECERLGLPKSSPVAWQRYFGGY